MATRVNKTWLLSRATTLKVIQYSLKSDDLVRHYSLSSYPPLILSWRWWKVAESSFSLQHWKSWQLVVCQEIKKIQPIFGHTWMLKVVCNMSLSCSFMKWSSSLHMCGQVHFTQVLCFNYLTVQYTRVIRPVALLVFRSRSGDQS